MISRERGNGRSAKGSAKYSWFECEESFDCGLRKIFPNRMGMDLRAVAVTWRMYKHVAAEWTVTTISKLV